VEIWDADDFDSWETLRWKTVRVIRYRQYKPNGKVHEAYWLTDFARHRVPQLPALPLSAVPRATSQVPMVH